MTTYKVHDPEQGLDEEFTDLKKAIKFANSCCQDHLQDGWSEEVGNITISQVLYTADQRDVIRKEDCKWDKNEESWLHPNGTHYSFTEWDYICDYKMAAVKR